MATYPIKMLKDENNNPFVPLVSTECVRDSDNHTLQQILNTKLGPANLLPGQYVDITTQGDNCYIAVDLPSALTLVDNLNATTANTGALDAHQGYILKNMIPTVVDDVTDTSATKALSANQGYVLNQKFSDYVLTTALENLVKQYILASHPIGSIEINITGTNPSNYLGGTWIAWGTGQVPVGVDTTQTEFNTVEKSGGNKNHTHIISHTHEVPGVEHTHTISHTHGVPGVAHAHTLSDAGYAKMTGWSADASLTYREVSGVTSWGSNYRVNSSSTGGGNKDSTYGVGLGGTTNNATPSATTTNSQSTTTSGKTTPSATTTNSQSTTDSGTASTLQPYITCYMWKRTA